MRYRRYGTYFRYRYIIMDYIKKYMVAQCSVLHIDSAQILAIIHFYALNLCQNVCIYYFKNMNEFKNG